MNIQKYTYKKPIHTYTVHMYVCVNISLYTYIALHVLQKMQKTSSTSHPAAKVRKLSAKVATTSLGLRCRAHAGRKPPQATVQVVVGTNQLEKY